MPKHIRFLLKHAVFGAFAALCFVSLLLWFNVANLWYLVTHTDAGPLALGIMTVFFVITFGSVQMGLAVMGLADKSDDKPPRGPKTPVLAKVSLGGTNTRNW